MKNPYEVLEINENATLEEIKKAYVRLSKKYHPDMHEDNPLKHLAEERMREINEAYEYLMNNDNLSDDELIHKAAINIENGNIQEAENLLNNVRTRNAEWFYLMGIINQKRGWYDAAYENFHRAYSVEPNNIKYKNAFESLHMQNNYYREPQKNRKDRDLCEICATLYCLDCLCESMGGDFIRCC